MVLNLLMNFYEMNLNGYFLYYYQYYYYYYYGICQYYLYQFDNYNMMVVNFNLINNFHINFIFNYQYYYYYYYYCLY